MNIEGDVQWLAPWSPVSASRAEGLVAELRRELGRGHAIFRRPARAIAARTDCDDVLFELAEPSQYAVVHLTYAGHPDRPPWPHTDLFADLNDFVERRMKLDHEQGSSDASSG